MSTSRRRGCLHRNAYLAANAEGLDKLDTALRETLKANPLNSPRFLSQTRPSTAIYLARTSPTYK